jgi:site-specific DNA recombinase
LPSPTRGRTIPANNRRLTAIMKRAAIYARFSSDLQDARSIGDQVALCCDYAQRQGYAVARVYEDAAASGASRHGRPGLARMLAEAETRAFDVLLAESMSRIGRDPEDRAAVRKQLKFFGVGIEVPAEGVVSPLVDGVRAVLDSEQLEDLKRHTRRGMGARVREGLSAGGLTYGYAAGAQKGTRVIVEEEAAIVRRIFAEYVAGRSPRDIARRLNEDRVKPPHGREWLASTINGNRARGCGILMNALYDGRLIWNRVAMRKDPRTGRRVSRANPQADWITRDVPGLRIVPAELYAQAQAEKTARAKRRPEAARRPRHLLAGLIRCGCCGGAMAVNNGSHAGRRIGCGRRKEGGRCEHARTYALAPIEARVLAALKARLAQPEAIEHYLASYREERKRLAKANAGRRAALERKLAQAMRGIERVVDGIARGTMSDDEARLRLPDLRNERDAAQAELATLAPTKPIEVHPTAIARYLAAVDDLAGSLQAQLEAGDGKAAAALRELIAAVTVKPGADARGEPLVEVTGRLAALMGGGEIFPQGEVSRTAVAGAGIEPATYGL